MVNGDNESRRIQSGSHGHLAWDSYEPSEGKFDFALFDKVMDVMNDEVIKVILGSESAKQTYSQLSGPVFNKVKAKIFTTNEDIRFATKGNVLYTLTI